MSDGHDWDIVADLVATGYARYAQWWRRWGETGPRPTGVYVTALDDDGQPVGPHMLVAEQVPTRNVRDYQDEVEP